MSNYLNLLTKNLKFYTKTIKDDIQQRKDADFFRPTGTQIYCGPQGSGKTASAVKHLLDLKARYPRMIIVTNLNLTNFSPYRFSLSEADNAILKDVSPRAADTATRNALISNLNQIQSKLDPSTQYIQFTNLDELSAALVAVNNSKYGVLYLIDEIHTYLNALDSKNIPMFIFTEISQQRKQRKCIIGTSQLFMRIAKPLREQCDNIIICNTYAGVFTTQKAYSGMDIDQDYSGNLTGKLLKTGFFVQTRELREAYDTFQKVVSATEQYDIQKPLEFSRKAKKSLSIK